MRNRICFQCIMNAFVLNFELLSLQSFREQQLEQRLIKEKTQVDAMVYETLKLLTNHKARIQEYVQEYKTTVQNMESTNR
eukprot:m.109368 g.109368  ORF g.109368 m.109368 type:complete len:80 (+) comp14000_c0_seq3:202-441(+)